MVISAGIQAGIFFLPVGVFIGLVVAAGIVLMLAIALVLQIALFPRRIAPIEEERLAASNFFAQLGEQL